ncbi:MAG TPA: NUDIX hydrolase [candidate division Zixibacteria bacterium]|nr:NUDIX hydrolase [candidate division Zixibacteria bacterium]
MKYAVDGILYREGRVILIKRAGKTFHGCWALPGGMLEEGEMVEKTLEREMKEELGVDVIPCDILGVYSEKNRDPRQHTISVVYICDYEGELKAGDDAAEYGIFEVNEAVDLELAFDHKKILQDFQNWLQKKGTFWSSKNRN